MTAVEELTEEDLVGQVLVGYAYGDAAGTVSAASAAGNQRLAGVDTPAEMVDRYRLGGVILVARSADDPTAGTNPTTNVDSPEQVRALTAGLRAAARLPLLIGTDQEYGVVTRIRSGIVQLPSAMAFGAAGDPALTERAWAAAGAGLATLGVNVDFAPVADVLGPGGVIGSRAFGGDPVAVARQVAAAVRGCARPGWPPPSSISPDTDTPQWTVMWRSRGWTIRWRSWTSGTCRRSSRASGPAPTW
jgi:beta-N-acetylhexosaminidase